MKYLPETLSYPDNEKPKLALLENLFRDWHQHFADNGSELVKHVADDMVFEGFYPYYFSQKKRVLFIGKESRQISGYNYIDMLSNAYRKGKHIGDQHLNRNKFHSRMLYIAYGIMNGMPKWQDIPYAGEIGDTFGDANGLSFAFMNISKLSNEGQHFASDQDAINIAHALSTKDRNFIQDQIAIMEPSIIITMKLEDKISSLGQLTPIDASSDAKSFWLDTRGHRSLLINTSHFSYWRKSDIAGYYTPICDAIRRIEPQLPA